MRYVGSRHYLADTSPLRSLSVPALSRALGVSPRIKAEGALCLARVALTDAQTGYAAARAALGKANRMPIDWKGGAGRGCRAYHQAEAMRTINRRRAALRAAVVAVAAAEAAVAALTPVDDFVSPYVASLAGVFPVQNHDAAQRVAA